MTCPYKVNVAHAAHALAFHYTTPSNLVVASLTHKALRVRLGRWGSMFAPCKFRETLLGELKL